MQEFFEKPMFTIPVVRNHAVSRMGMQLQFSKFPIDLIH